MVQRKVGSGTFVVRSESREFCHFGLLIPGLGNTEIFEPICAQMAATAHGFGHSIVCGNDVTAGALMHRLDQLGVDVPGDIRVAGVDDVKYAELLRVPLTTIRQPCVAIGEAAFRAMLDRVEMPDAPGRDILLSCDLVVRDSTA